MAIAFFGSMAQPPKKPCVTVAANFNRESNAVAINTVITRPLCEYAHQATFRHPSHSRTTAAHSTNRRPWIPWWSQVGPTPRPHQQQFLSHCGAIATPPSYALRCVAVCVVYDRVHQPPRAAICHREMPARCSVGIGTDVGAASAATAGTASAGNKTIMSTSLQRHCFDTTFSLLGPSGAAC